MKRRDFLLGSAAVTIPSQSLAELLVVAPNTELSIRSDKYARLAANGPLEPAESAYKIALDGGAVSCLVYVSPGARKANLVVFSHDALSEPQVYSPLISFLTTHGYCVVAPIHEDSILLDGLSLQASMEAITSSGRLNDSRLWEKRVYDCRLLRDSYSIISNSIGITINATNPIVIGHSMGAYTAQLLLGASVETASGVMKFVNDGWAGGVLLNPQGKGVLGLSDTSWSEVSSPILSVVSKHDRDILGQELERRLDPHYLARAPYKHLAYLEKGGNEAYSGQRARPGTEDYYIFFDVRSVVAGFLEAYSKRNEETLKSMYLGETLSDSYGYVMLSSR